ncbi:MAG TPA: ABC transporter ATP-binding protein [Methylomirabilota bacterium]|nr:ABC transporter ATP-binding protein [Methylomirabilota bacterium]
MSDTVIDLDCVAKRYRLRRGWHVTSLRDEVVRLGSRVLGRAVEPREEFWALRDVTFSLERGEILGLVGMNGAGKSTLLKILSKVTVPTRGSFVARGRLGALIEIGAGFHPELSGRENIFLNGAIMGMSRREVQGKFDRIVAFAEVERFIDTPIKHYSSGMQMRLGFAVAAHTDPDILLIDEILAVGDASFQAKCLNKLAELKEEDKTIILVSHNLTTITEHSKRVLWLDHGAVRMIGEPDAVVDSFLQHVTEEIGGDDEGGGLGAREIGRQIRILDVCLADEFQHPQARFDRGDAVLIDVAYSASEAMPGAVFLVSIQDVQGYPLGGVSTDPDAVRINGAIDRGVVRLRLDPLILNKGVYTLSVHALDPGTKRYYDVKRRAVRILVDGELASSRQTSGHVYYPHQWEQLK